MDLYSVKMRASEKTNGLERHVSGSERIVSSEKLESVCAAMVRRALHHAKGDPDRIDIRLERVEESQILRLKALPVRTIDVATPKAGQAAACQLLESAGIPNARDVLAKMPEVYSMRGAMLLDIHSLKRLEPIAERGIRAAYMDYENSEALSGGKDHFREALVLATKVAACPSIIAEICISDDPDYVTGYVAAKKLGYVRITKLKEPGDENGGRIFMFDSSLGRVEDCIEFIQKQKVLIVN